MALTRRGFICTAAGSAAGGGDVGVVDTGECRTVLVGVAGPEEGIEVARRLMGGGVQLIELCGGSGPVRAGRVIEAIDGAVPVGTVGHGPEAVDQVHVIFSRPHAAPSPARPRHPHTPPPHPRVTGVPWRCGRP
jgi:hypothetical protein